MTSRPILHTVFFDAGGTLAKADDLLTLIVQELSAKAPCPSRTVLAEKFSVLLKKSPETFLDVKEILTHVMKEVEQETSGPDFSQRAVELYRETYLEKCDLYDGVQETLRALKQHGVKMFIISNADADILRPEFVNFGISEFFDAMLISSEVKSYKPYDGMINAARAYCQVPLEGILLVGDSTEDVLTAQKLGISSARITDKKGDETYTIASFAELWPMIDKKYAFPSM